LRRLGRAGRTSRKTIGTITSPVDLTGADPFVIARAQLGKPVWTVVSGEKASDANNPKIPFVCGQLDVPCLTFRQFWQNEGWSF
jgi:hypothetical protein